MNCAEYQDLIHSYLGDELEEQILTEIESHLAGCADCSHELANLKTSLNHLRRTFPDRTPPAELWEKIKAQMD
jgi:anti-sigma factor RsiW